MLDHQIKELARNVLLPTEEVRWYVHLAVCSRMHFYVVTLVYTHGTAILTNCGPSERAAERILCPPG